VHQLRHAARRALGVDGVSAGHDEVLELRIRLCGLQHVEDTANVDLEVLFGGKRPAALEGRSKMIHRIHAVYGSLDIFNVRYGPVDKLKVERSELLHARVPLPNETAH